MGRTYSRISVERHGHTVTGYQFSRGGSPIRGGGTYYGWTITCTCGWSHRVNDTKREAESYARHHLNEHKS